MKMLGLLLCSLLAVSQPGSAYVSGRMEPADEAKTDKDTKPPAEFKEEGIPTTNKVTGLQLPADQEVKGSTRVVSITAEAKGEVKWLVMNQGKTPVQAMSSGKTLLVFPNDEEDIIAVMAYTSVDGKPSDTAKTLVKVIRSKPAPTPPDPAPTRPVAKTPFFVSMIVSPDTQTPDLANTVNDQSLRNYLSQQGHRLFVLSPRSPSVTGGIAQALQNAGGPPALIIQDADGWVIWHERLKDAASVKAAVDKLSGR